MKKILSILLALVMCLTLCACGAAAPEAAAPEAAAPAEDAPMELLFGRDPSYYEVDLAKGPNGEDATSTLDVNLTDEEYKTLRDGKYTAAISWATAGGEWNNAVANGIEAEFEKMGIEIVAIANAEGDIAKQQADVETMLALDPDILISLPLDPVSGGEIYKPAYEQGVSIGFVDNGVDGYTPGKEYVGISTSNTFAMGRAAADLTVEAAGGSGKIVVVYYDADFYVTNNRDGMVEYTLKTKYADDVEVVSLGFVSSMETSDIANTILALHPDTKAVFVSWDVAAQPIVAEFKAAGREDIKIVAMDLSGPNDVECVNGGVVYGKVADKPFEIGECMAKMCALDILGKEAPQYACSEVVIARKDTINNKK